MPIKSFELTSVDAKRFSKIGEKIPHLRVDHNATVTSISAVSDKSAQIEFRFTVNYVGMGMVRIEGKVVWDGDAKEIASQWSSSNKLPNEVFNPVLAAVFSNCMPAAVVVARDLGLPPPLPPPQIQGTQGARGPPGKRDRGSAMEVA